MSFIPDDTLKVIESVAKIVTEMAGIQLGPKQYAMIENRLKSRMLRIGITDFKSYLEYLKKHSESESQALLSLMTTHHTYFFREFSHFEFLLNKALPQLIEEARKRHDKTIHILSAACSRGQEAYSLAMFFSYHLSLLAPDIGFSIWGTDIDPESVEYAKNGVYKNDQLNQVPAMYLGQHWSRGEGQVKEFSRVKKSLKEKCHFTVANLLNYHQFLSGRKFDVIFCRNVFIYFNSQQIAQVTKKLIDSLESSGFLFLGVSETLNGLDLKVQSIGPSVYQHPKIEKVNSTKQMNNNNRKEVLEVLCVDDSPVIHTLLKKILIPNYGFRVKAVAKNGQEALELLSKNEFDIITLDLHMPVLDGVQFLQKNKNKDIPIVVISSINRDDLSIAQKAVSLGACDYVEKPSLENLSQAGNEIRSKLNLSYLSKQTRKTQDLKPTGDLQSLNLKDKTKIKVMIVDDSSTIRSLLRRIIIKDNRFEVIAEAAKPSEALEILKKVKPDVMTLDIHMPEMDGVALLKKIHPIYKIPTIMISSVSRDEGTLVFDALESGAVDYIQKPDTKTLTSYETDIREKIIAAASSKFTKSSRVIARVKGGNQNLQSLIVIGASTGGTEALKHVLLGLPNEIPPILIVQHIPPVFSTAFASRLNDLCPFEVKEAADNDEIKPNKVFIAPGGKQMGIRNLENRLVITVKDDPPVNRHKPSVDYLFESVSRISIEPAVAVILTGMGADGAKGLKKLRDLGFRTIGQDAASSIVYGMPKEAKIAGGVEFELPLEKISGKILELISIDFKSQKKRVG